MAAVIIVVLSWSITENQELLTQAFLIPAGWSTCRFSSSFLKYWDSQDLLRPFCTKLSVHCIVVVLCCSFLFTCQHPHLDCKLESQRAYVIIHHATQRLAYVTWHPVGAQGCAE